MSIFIPREGVGRTREASERKADASDLD